MRDCLEAPVANQKLSAGCVSETESNREGRLAAYFLIKFRCVSRWSRLTEISQTAISRGRDDGRRKKLGNHWGVTARSP